MKKLLQLLLVLLLFSLGAEFVSSIFSYNKELVFVGEQGEQEQKKEDENGSKGEYKIMPFHYSFYNSKLISKAKHSEIAFNFITCSYQSLPEIPPEAL